jgi:hypothetical protein
MGKKTNASRAFWWRNSKERDHFRDVCVDGRIIVNCILNIYCSCGLNSSGSGQGTLEGSCDYGKEPSSFIKHAKFLD